MRRPQHPLNPKSLEPLKWAASSALLLLVLAFGQNGRADVNLTILASFDGTNGDHPEGALIQGQDGSFYGTTIAGGIYTNYGTVFKVTIDGALTNLVSFNYTNGAFPQSGLMQGADGTLYGTTYSGGTYGDGTVFALSTNGTSFNSIPFGPDGDGPNAVLIQNAAGELYGTTQFGGTYHAGSVFQVAQSGVITNLVSFNGTNGSYPYDGGLVLGGDGSYYGTTQFGGTGFDGSAIYSGYGTAFKTTVGGDLTNFFFFNGTNGAFPVGVLAQGFDGNLYGTTCFGGSGFNGLPTSGAGTVFKITMDGTFTTLAWFDGTNNGANPFAGVIVGTDGNVYGTTQYGGTNYPPNPNAGTVFQLTPEGRLTTLVSFAVASGAEPVGGVVQGGDGSFYGTTTIGGANGVGGIFRLSVAGGEVPKIQIDAATQGQVRLNWVPLAGRAYQVQYKTNLSQAAWSNVGSTVIGTNRFATVSDPIGPNQQRFYRVALLPQPN